MRTAARPIRIDKRALRRGAKHLVEQLVREAQKRRGRPFGRSLWLETSLRLKDVEGDPLPMRGVLQSVPMPHGLYIDGAVFDPAKAALVVRVNGSIDPTPMTVDINREALEKRVFHYLIHEATHAADVYESMDRPYAQSIQNGEHVTEDTIDPRMYYNDTIEVRAFMQQIVDEILEKRRHTPLFMKRFPGGKAFEYIMNMSSTWGRVKKHLNKRNRKLMLKGVWTALNDEGLMNTAEKKALARAVVERTAGCGAHPCQCGGECQCGGACQNREADRNMEAEMMVYLDADHIDVDVDIEEVEFEGGGANQPLRSRRDYGKMGPGLISLDLPHEQHTTKGRYDSQESGLPGLQEKWAAPSGKQLVYPDPNSRHPQPPGLLNVEPALAKIMGWRPLGEVKIPSSSGVKDTPVKDLAGVPVNILSRKNIDRIDEAYKNRIELPPIDIEVHKDKIQLVDGHHRLEYARKNRVRSIPVRWHIRAAGTSALQQRWASGMDLTQVDLKLSYASTREAHSLKWDGFIEDNTTFRMAGSFLIVTPRMAEALMLAHKNGYIAPFEDARIYRNTFKALKRRGLIESLNKTDPSGLRVEFGVARWGLTRDGEKVVAEMLKEPPLDRRAYVPFVPDARPYMEDDARPSNDYFHPDSLPRDDESEDHPAAPTPAETLVRNATRPIPLDRRELEKLTLKILKAIRRELKRGTSVDDLYVEGTDKFQGQLVRWSAYGDKRRGGHLVWGKWRGQTNELILKVDGNLDADYLLLPATLRRLKERLSDIISHEMTHALDPSPEVELTKSWKFKTKRLDEKGRMTQEWKENYYNDPREVRAFMRQIFEEMRKQGPQVEGLAKAMGRSKGLGTYAFSLSQTWKDISPYLTEENKRKVKKGVLRALSDEGIIKMGSRWPAAETYRDRIKQGPVTSDVVAGHWHFLDACEDFESAFKDLSLPSRDLVRELNSLVSPQLWRWFSVVAVSNPAQPTARRRPKRKASHPAAKEYAQRMQEGPITREDVAGHGHLLDQVQTLKDSMTVLKNQTPSELHRELAELIDFDGLTRWFNRLMVPMPLVAEPASRRRRRPKKSFQDLWFGRVAKERSDKEKDEIYAEWRKLINMSPKELEDWADNPDRLEASLSRDEAKGGVDSGYDSLHRIKRRVKKKLSEWTDDDYDNAAQENSFNNRMLGNDPGDPEGDTGRSKWEISLRNWGHAPSKKSSPAHSKWEAWKKKQEKKKKKEGAQHKDHIPGGLADKNKPSDFDPEQLKKGIKVEMEHTGDPNLAREIAMDHLTEIPNYYDLLERMEAEAEKKACRRQASGRPITVFHGTTTDSLSHIRSKGLESRQGYNSAKWYMVAEDYESAYHHAQGYEGTPVVVELRVPTEPKVSPTGRERRMWDGYPYLWKPSNLSWEGKATRWWALRQPIPAEFVVRVHKGKDKRAARPIPLDKQNLKRLSGLLSQELYGMVSEMPADMTLGESLSKFTTSKHRTEVTPYGREPVAIRIGYEVRPGRGVVSGGFIAASSRGGQSVLVFTLSRRATVGTLRQQHERGVLKDELYGILSHEMTHAKDPETYQSGGSKGLHEYLNNPAEVRARMSDVAREVGEVIEDYLDFGSPKDALQMALADSPTWGDIKPLLNPRNKKHVLKGVYTSLQDAGLF